MYHLMDGATQVASYRLKREADKVAEEMGVEVEKEVLLEPVENALHITKTMMNNILDKSGATHYTGYLSGPTNYRDKLATIKPYKGNRLQEKPVHYQAVRDYLIYIVGGKVTDGIEADDALGIAQMQPFKEDDTIICSTDKDLDMIPGWHYNWGKEAKYWIDEETAYRNFYKQLLTGDAVDNIPGLEGVGKGGAETFLSKVSNPVEMEMVVLERYTLVHGGNARKIMQEIGSLLWIQREEGQVWGLGGF